MPTSALTDLSPAEWLKLIRTTLDTWRDGPHLALAESPLAHSPLVTACFLAAEPVTPDARARAMQVLLRWAVECQRPDGAHSWVAKPWRVYNLLHYFYDEGMQLLPLTRKMTLTSLTQARRDACAALATLLQSELRQPQATAERQRAYLTGRYERYTAADRCLLRATALFRQPVPAALPEQLASSAGVAAQPDWARLNAAGWLVYDAEDAKVMAQPDARPHLLKWLTPAEHAAWHQQVGAYYATQRNYLEAVEHLRLAGAGDEAAQVLVRHYEDVLQQLETQRLQGLLRAFQAAEVTQDNWARLRLRAGQLAESTQDIATALAEYEQAFSAATEPVLQAEACYRRARAFGTQNAEQALAHYQYCIRLLAPHHPPHDFWLLSWVGVAWFHLNRHEQALARAALAMVEPWREQAPVGVRARICNALGQWWSFETQWNAAIAHYHQGWLAALEAQDPEAQLTSAHSLGTLYARQGQHAHSFDYLTQGLALARRLNNRRMEGLLTKGLGQYYYWLRDDVEATRYYRQANTIFQAMDNRLGQAVIAHDLVEVLARQHQYEEARLQLKTALKLGRELEMPDFLLECESLADTYPPLRVATPVLTEHQQRLLDWARARERFTSADCVKFLGFTKKHVFRVALNKLLALGLVKPHGIGRGIYYTAP